MFLLLPNLKEGLKIFNVVKLLLFFELFESCFRIVEHCATQKKLICRAFLEKNILMPPKKTFKSENFF